MDLFEWSTLGKPSIAGTFYGRSGVELVCECGASWRYFWWWPSTWTVSAWDECPGRFFRIGDTRASAKV